MAAGKVCGRGLRLRPRLYACSICATQRNCSSSVRQYGLCRLAFAVLHLSIDTPAFAADWKQPLETTALFNDLILRFDFVRQNYFHSLISRSIITDFVLSTWDILVVGVRALPHITDIGQMLFNTSSTEKL